MRLIGQAHEVTVDLDGRVLPGQTPADLVRELEGLASDLAEFEVVHEEPAVGAEPDAGDALAVVGGFGSYVAMGLPVRLLHFSATSLAIGALAFALSESLRRCVFAGTLPFWAAIVVAVATANISDWMSGRNTSGCSGSKKP